jgi:hypothetical protein
MTPQGARRPPFWRRYLRLVRDDVRGDVDEELAFHLDMRVERNIALGLSPDDARREALARFGDVRDVRDQLVSHDQRHATKERRAEYFGDLVHDLRFGARSMRRSPGFAIAAILTLALGIGANAAMFSVVNAVVLQPLPYPQAERLVSLGMGSAGEYFALRDRLHTLDALAAWVSITHPVDDGTSAERLEGAAITANTLSLLGTRPASGRTFTAADEQPGAAPVVPISHALWQRKFGGARAGVIGRLIAIEGVPCEIVGIMPEGFAFPNSAAEYWQPYPVRIANAGITWAVTDKHIIGRLAHGTVTSTRARRGASRACISPNAIGANARDRCAIAIDESIRAVLSSVA